MEERKRTLIDEPSNDDTDHRMGKVQAAKGLSDPAMFK